MRVICCIPVIAFLLASCGKQDSPQGVRPPTTAEAAAKPVEAEAPAKPSPSGSGESARAVTEASRAAPAPLTLSAGTRIRVRTTTTLSTKSAHTGQPFTATLEQPLIHRETVIAPKGTRVEGRVVESDPGGRVSGRAGIAIRLVALNLPGGTIAELTTDVHRRQARATKKKDAVKIGAGAAFGAALGALAGGGRGAAIGAASGGAAGTGVVLATRGDAAVIPAESILTFTLRAPTSIAR